MKLKLTPNNPTQPASPSPQLLSRRQVAERWSVCPHTVARTKELVPIRFNGRRLRYRLSDVEALEQQTASTSA